MKNSLGIAVASALIAGGAGYMLGARQSDQSQKYTDAMNMMQSQSTSIKQMGSMMQSSGMMLEQMGMKYKDSAMMSAGKDLQVVGGRHMMEMEAANTSMGHMMSN